MCKPNKTQFNCENLPIIDNNLKIINNNNNKVKNKIDAMKLKVDQSCKCISKTNHTPMTLTKLKSNDKTDLVKVLSKSEQYVILTILKSLQFIFDCNK